MMNFEASARYAEYLDKKDSISNLRKKFYLPKSNTLEREIIYFCGNSLGLQPKNSKEFVNNEFDAWASSGVDAHVKELNPWVSYHEIVAKSLSQLLGAKEEEVVAMNSLTTNLHLLMISFYRPNKKRFKIVIEKGAFPSDRYAVLSQLKFHGFDESSLIEIKPKENKNNISTEDFCSELEKNSDSIALVLLAGVQYYTGQLFDMPTIIRKSHEIGCTIGLDLAHAIGNVPLYLHSWKADFAVWCSYKYLNSGPGGIGGAFIHNKHLNSELPRLHGWWGSEKEHRFEMREKFVPIHNSVEAWQLSNPPIFQIAALNASLSIFNKYSIHVLREKSLQLTSYLYFLLISIRNKKEIFDIITPKDPLQRGCQISLKFKIKAKAIYNYLQINGVTCDYRYPNVIRIAPVPLYNTFTEVFEFYKLIIQGLIL
jgi:kynureninase